MIKVVRFSTATLVAMCLFGITTQCHAQGNATVPIVVVDLSKVFDQHPQFQQTLQKIKSDVKAAEADFQNKGKQIQERVKQLKEFKPTSEEYIRLETETARVQGQIQAEMALKKKDFLEREAQAYYQTYQQVRNEIKAFAEANRIGLVLRFSSEQIDPNNRQSVLQGVNQPILYNQGGLDITRFIVDRVVRANGGAARTARAPQGTQRARQQ